MSAMGMIEQPFKRSLKTWAFAVRAYSYPASIVPVVVGSVYAIAAGGRANAVAFNWVFFVLALIAGMAYHTASNLINCYFDHKYGVDTEPTHGSGLLVTGAMTPKEYLVGAWTCLGLGTAIGAFFIWYYWFAAAVTYPLGWPILAIGLAGFLGAVFYTATPLSAKYNALGEPLVFLMMGVGMVLGAYFVQAGVLSWGAVWVSLPVAFMVAAILQANDTRDIADDRQSRITTAATLLGATGARWYFYFLTLAPYATVVLLALTGVTGWFALLPLLTLPLALKLVRLFQTVSAEKDERLLMTPPETAKLHLAFGLLLSIGVLIGRWI